MRFNDDWLIQTEIQQISKTKKVINDYIKKIPKKKLKELSSRGHYSKQYDLKYAFDTQENFQFITQNKWFNFFTFIFFSFSLFP